MKFVAVKQLAIAMGVASLAGFAFFLVGMGEGVFDAYTALSEGKAPTLWDIGKKLYDDACNVTICVACRQNC